MNEISVLISGESYNASRQSITISDQAGAISSSTVDVKIGTGQAIPRALEAVQVLFDSVPVLFGFIDTVDTPEWNYGTEVDRARLSIKSGAAMFDWRIASEAYENKYTHEIVSDLFTNYIATEGITLGEISVTENLYEKYTLSFSKLSSALHELSEQVDACYYISPDKKFYFVTRNAVVSMDAPTHVSALKMSESGSDLVSVQIVTGATEETTTQNEGSFWSAGQNTVVCSYPFATLSGATINGTPVGFGILSVDDEDITKTFLWKYGSQVVTLNKNATVQPAAGDNVVFIYTGSFDIVVQNNNDALIADLAALNGTSGRIESVYTDESIESYADANTLANNLLANKDDREQTVTAQCQEIEKTDLFTEWVFNRPDLHITGKYVIVGRSISDFYDKYLIKVTLKNKGFYLRYGTVLKKGTKIVRKDTVVYKQTAIGDTATTSEVLTFDTGGTIFYPASVASGKQNDPGLADGFYPQAF